MQQVLKVLATKGGYALLQWFIICHGEIEQTTVTYLLTHLIHGTCWTFHISLSISLLFQTYIIIFIISHLGRSCISHLAPGWFSEFVRNYFKEVWQSMRFLSLIPRRFYYTTFANGVTQSAREVKIHENGSLFLQPKEMECQLLWKPIWRLIFPNRCHAVQYWSPEELLH